MSIGSVLTFALVMLVASLARKLFRKKKAATIKADGDMVRTKPKPENLVINSNLQLIHSSDKSMTEWLAEKPDPSLWHLLVRNLNYDFAHTIPTIKWIVQQPQCYPMTALLALDQLQVIDLCESPKDEGNGKLYAESADIVHVITKLSGADFYTDFSFGEEGLTDEATRLSILSACVDANRNIIEQGKSPSCHPPAKLFQSTFGDKKSIPTYVVNQNGVFASESQLSDTELNLISGI